MDVVAVFLVDMLGLAVDFDLHDKRRGELPVTFI